MTVAISKFIRLGMPLLPLKPMAQSWRGVAQRMGVQVSPLTVTISKFIQLSMFEIFTEMTGKDYFLNGRVALIG
jgi:hypothetical protein